MKHPVALVALLTLLIPLAGGCATPVTRTHHSLVRVMWPDQARGEAARPADFDAAARIVDRWALAEGMEPTPEGAPRRSYITADSPSLQARHYRQARPAVKDWPIELLISHDPRGAGDVQVMMSEGAHREPTERFRAMHESLAAELRAHFGDKVKANIW